MMDTILNVGMNREVAERLSEKTGNAWFAWDSYRRFLQCYGMAWGIARDDFDAIIDTFKKRVGIRFKRHFPGEKMKTLALEYENYIGEKGYPILHSSFDQLLFSIQKVFESWELPKAKAYRKIIGISDDWGTAVTIQKMVFGNISQLSGSGVLFTHNPGRMDESLMLWGDFTIGNQGEDVVSGLVNTLPISEMQQIEQNRMGVTLERQFPSVYKELKKFAGELIEKQGWGPQEIEFTFESPDSKGLYILQTRDMVLKEKIKKYTFYPDSKEMEKKFLAHGIGVSGSAMCGRAVFTLGEIRHWQKKEPGKPVILIRGDTVPDDIVEINAAEGLLTARGGMTSHASVVAHRLNKTCVVGCSELICNENISEATIKGRVIHSGDYISIDGHEGSVYAGFLNVNGGV
jgi:pyruvate,orthophosphate dikinase